MLERVLGKIDGAGRPFAQFANDAVLADLIRSFHATLDFID